MEFCGETESEKSAVPVAASSLYNKENRGAKTPCFYQFTRKFEPAKQLYLCRVSQKLFVITVEVV